MLVRNHSNYLAIFAVIGLLASGFAFIVCSEDAEAASDRPVTFSLNGNDVPNGESVTISRGEPAEVVVCVGNPMNNLVINGTAITKYPCDAIP